MTTMVRLRRKKTLFKMTIKQKETHECDFKLHECNKNDEEHGQNKK